MFKISIRIFLTLILTLIYFASHAQLADTPWPMYMHDIRHTGVSPYAGPLEPKIIWTYNTAKEVVSGIAIDNVGNIYFGSRDNNFLH